MRLTILRLLLWNSDYFTNLPLHVGMHAKIYGAREGGPLLKLFSGRVETLKALDKGARGNTVHFERQMLWRGIVPQDC
jgi:hypothetical protein